MAGNLLRGRVLAYCRLLRLPNVFTAAADVLMGAWIAAPSAAATLDRRLLLLLVSSGSLYLAGMVWNDLFDVEVDRRERPQRPLPSGAISDRAATVLGVALIALGTGAAAGAGYAAGSIAAALAILIVAYDGSLKQTPFGPAAMGGCRLLNVLLGMSAATAVPSLRWELLVALGNGVYIAGVTWFARQEATQSRRAVLVAATAVMSGGLVLDAVAIVAAARADWPTWLAFAGFVAIVGRPLVRAIETPAPVPVQRAIKTTVLGLIGLDAVLVLAFCGMVPALAVLALLPPALALGRWVYST